MDELIYDMDALDRAQDVAAAGAFKSLSVSCQLNRAQLRRIKVTEANIDGVRLHAQLYETTAPGGVPTSTAVGQPVRMVHTGGGSYICGVPAPTVTAGTTFAGYVKVSLGYPVEVPTGLYDKASISETDAATKIRSVRFTKAAS